MGAKFYHIGLSHRQRTLIIQACTDISRLFPCLEKIEGRTTKHELKLAGADLLRSYNRKHKTNLDTVRVV